MTIQLAAGAAGVEAAVVSVESEPTTIQVAGSTVGWSSFDATSGRYFLTVRRNGVTSRLPVAGRPVVFDLDLGLDKRGRTLLTYSRCRVERQTTGSFRPDWSAGRRCRIYEYDFDQGRERRIPTPGLSASGSTAVPAIWGDRVVFAYAATPRADVRVYVADRRTGARRRRVPSGTGDGLHPAPTSIDLSSRYVSYVWGNLATKRCKPINPKLTADASAEDLWLVRLPARRRRVARACESGRYRRFDSVALSRSRLLVRALGVSSALLTVRLADPGLTPQASPLPEEATVSYARSANTVAYVTSDGRDYPITVEQRAEPDEPGE